MEHIINIQKKLEPIGLKIGVIWLLYVFVAVKGSSQVFRFLAFTLVPLLPTYLANH